MEKHHADPSGRKSSERRRAAENRYNPKRRVSSPPSSAHPDPGRETDSSPAGKGRTGIVSVNGRDVGVMRCQQR